MKTLMDAIVNHLVDTLDFVKKGSMNEGGNIFFGDALYQTPHILSITTSSLDDVMNISGGYFPVREIRLTIIWYGGLNYYETYQQALQINNAFKNPQYCRKIHKNILYMEVGTMEYSDKVEDRYVFSMDVSLHWSGELY